MKFTLNGKVMDEEVAANVTLLEFLRDKFNRTSVKMGCDEGECGTCTVLLNGETVNSCLVLAVQVENQEVTTLEGLGANGELDVIQRAFLENYGTQCGFCTPGMVLATKSLLDRTPFPSKEQIKEALEGNLCRCTGYQQIIESVLKAAEMRTG